MRDANRDLIYVELNASHRSWTDFTGVVVDRALLMSITGEAALAPSAYNM